ncbi:MAG: hypothetical protein AAGJ70_03470 [Pseudomonadota bacterium]
MISLQFVLVLAIGAGCGWFAAQITGLRTRGLATDMTVGVIGAALTALVLPEFLAWGRLLALVSGAVFFSCLMLLCVAVFRKRRAVRQRQLAPEERLATQA